MKKLFLMGGRHADIPIILAAQSLGYYVITTGNIRDELGHKFSNRYIPGDFSNAEEMLRITEQEKVDAICPCTNDFSIISCAYVAEKTGLSNLDSLQNTIIIHHKDKFREFASRIAINSPKSGSFTSVSSAYSQIDDFKFPIIIKPVDLTGGKGVQRVNRKEDVLKAIEQAFDRSRSKRIVIEEFIEGSNHAISTILRNEKVVFYFIDNEHYYINPYLVSGASTNPNISDKVIQVLIHDIEKIAQTLHLKDGIFHAQFILRNNIPYMIDVCRRPPGDFYVDMVSYATNINYPLYVLKAYLGMDISELSFAKSYKLITRHCVMGDKNGIYKGLLIDDSIKDLIFNSFTLAQTNDQINDYLTFKAAIIFLQYTDYEQMKTVTQRLPELIKIQYA